MAENEFTTEATFTRFWVNEKILHSDHLYWFKCLTQEDIWDYLDKKGVLPRHFRRPSDKLEDHSRPKSGIRDIYIKSSILEKLYE